MTASVEALESASYAMWSPDEQTEIDGWVARACGGFTRRLNSATGTSTATVGRHTHARLSAWFRERRLPLTIRVTPVLGGERTERVATGWDLVPSDPTLVMVADPLPMGQVDGVDLVAPRTSGFLEVVLDLNGRPRGHLPDYHRVVDRLGDAAIGLAIGTEAVGLVAVSGTRSSVYSVAVAPEAQRKGRGTQIMRAASAWAARAGAESQLIQVLASNRPAIGLYQDLGFEVAYRYSYLEPEGAPPDASSADRRPGVPGPQVPSDDLRR